MCSLLVVTGPPGAGKSTVARILADRADYSVLVDGDRFFAFLVSGAVEPWRPEAHDQNTVVVTAAAAATGQFAAGGLSTVYDGVIGPWFLPTFAAASHLGELDFVVLLPTLDTCLHRVMTRSDHGFRDEPATRQMYREFADAAVAPRHVLTLGDETPTEVADRIDQARRRGDLTFVTPR